MRKKGKPSPDPLQKKKNKAHQCRCSEKKNLIEALWPMCQNSHLDIIHGTQQ